MEFRTKVEPLKNLKAINHSDEIMLFGSCFAQNIGNLLTENKFRCDVNPFGVLYNPLSIIEAIYQIIDRKSYTQNDLFFDGVEWHSWMHHSSFSDMDMDRTLFNINSRLVKANENIGNADWLFITFGTAYVYFLQDGTVAGNCHKQSDKLFDRHLINVNRIINEWKSLLVELKKINPNIKIMFTVSPIRHIKDGLHGNQISKSTLLLAVNDICNNEDNCFYFPSYEIMMDDLRDYRFYAEDMVHPSQVAVNYIWEIFEETTLSQSAKDIINEWDGIKKGLNHRPFNPHSTAYHKFLTQIVLKINRMKEKFPYFDVQKEIEQCQAQLKTLAN